MKIISAIKDFIRVDPINVYEKGWGSKTFRNRPLFHLDKILFVESTGMIRICDLRIC